MARITMFQSGRLRILGLGGVFLALSESGERLIASLTRREQAKASTDDVEPIQRPKKRRATKTRVFREYDYTGGK